MPPKLEFIFSVLNCIRFLDRELFTNLFLYLKEAFFANKENNFETGFENATNHLNSGKVFQHLIKIQAN